MTAARARRCGGACSCCTFFSYLHPAAVRTRPVRRLSATAALRALRAAATQESDAPSGCPDWCA
eukprot:6884751-Prymnesium_polylepis.1